MKHLITSSLDFLNHGILAHPENRERLEAILEGIEKSPYRDYLDLSINRLATFEELSLVHHPDYIALILSLQGKEAALDEETLLTEGSVHAALLAAGQGLELVERVWNGEADNGFALVRPPGHHARPAQGMGFCIFNNIAIAVKRLLALGAQKLMILDWDVHHGNGTQEMFYNEKRVLFIDLHQDNLFPRGSGLATEKGVGTTFNIPLPPLLP